VTPLRAWLGRLLSLLESCQWCGGKREQLYGVPVCAECGVRLP
jgi:hypothetical protein